MDDNLTDYITDFALRVCGKILSQDTTKLSRPTKDLNKKRQSIIASNPKDRKELAELSKLSNKLMVTDIKKSNMGRTEFSLMNTGSLKAMKSKLHIGKNQTYAVSATRVMPLNSMDKIGKIAYELYRDLNAKAGKVTVAGATWTVMEEAVF